MYVVCSRQTCMPASFAPESLEESLPQMVTNFGYIWERDLQRVG